MRYQSAERRKLMRIWSPVRARFVMETNHCWFQGSECQFCWNLGVHEMAKGSHREAALTRRYTWAVACGHCNCGELNDYKLWPLERQLAMKWIYDRPHFWLVAFNVLRDRNSEAITFSEVLPHILRRLDGKF